MASFPEVLAGAVAAGGGRAVTVPATWHQGRTAYGGFSAALALDEAQRVGGGEMPPLRSAQISMIAPLFGNVEVSAQVVRRGRNATWVEARIVGEMGLGLTASFVFMGPIESALAVDRQAMPEDVIAPGEASTLSRERGAVFLRNNFEVRFARPKMPERVPEMCWWVRLDDRAGLDPMVELLLCADALPPGAMSILGPSVPVSTMQWHVNALTARPETRDGWWLLRSTGDYAHAGCSSQTMALWNGQGESVAAGMQSIALFG
ncbi:hypothetical protein B2G71_16620 [Novosphingobium sp. PC22D]|uniref:acyl-CoA thioesterase n=1 Tax=Novosphingobium sp. PC22D TaxID=1962403 RepID=UPI000BF1B274|nr:thioesterase family protein [Novosphingobium sp. PC22D]PEQ11456.1 hypothetical protein B2G71_16620 [Novosphingobium sp. PC22D]